MIAKALRILLIVPAVAWIVWYSLVSYSTADIYKSVRPVSQLGWLHNGKPISVDFHRLIGPENETIIYHIKFSNFQKQELKTDRLVFNSDLWGTGYVAAANVDSNPTFELVAWTNAGRSFYYTLNNGSIIKHPWSDASASATQLMNGFRDANLTFTFLNMTLVVLVLLYLLIFAIWLPIKMLSKRRKQSFPRP